MMAPYYVNYKVVNIETGEIVAYYKLEKYAIKRANKLNDAYDWYMFVVKKIGDDNLELAI